MAPASIAARAAATSTSSKACVGTHTMRDTRPGLCPERPARYAPVVAGDYMASLHDKNRVAAS